MVNTSSAIFLMLAWSSKHRKAMDINPLTKIKSEVSLEVSPIEKRSALLAIHMDAKETTPSLCHDTNSVIHYMIICNLDTIKAHLSIFF